MGNPGTPRRGGRYFGGAQALAILLLASAFTACGSAIPDANGDRPGEGQWGPCPDGYLDECTTLRLPLSEEGPSDQLIDVLITRHRSAASSASQLWFLPGGPGLSMTAYRSWALALSDNLMVDVYGIDHRGVGGSERLGCKSAESTASVAGTTITGGEWPACISEFNTSVGAARRDHFTTSDAARDLGLAIDRLRDHRPAFIYGHSYGTYWALRYLQLHSRQVDGVILDSINTPGRYLSDFDKQFDPVLMALLDVCAGTPVCSAKLGIDPKPLVAELFDALAHGHCSETITSAVLSGVLAELLMDERYREMIPPLLYRLHRCDAGDRLAIASFLAHRHRSDALSLATASPVLQLHVALSEFWPDPSPSDEELQDRDQRMAATPGTSVSLAPFARLWPRYPHDRFVGAWPDTDIPMLMLNGTLDPQTPIESAREAGRRFAAPGQHFVAFPWAPHGVALHSAVISRLEPPCGTQVIQAFLTDPQADPNVSCLTRLAPPSFDFDVPSAHAAFGQDDIWENNNE